MLFRQQRYSVILFMLTFFWFAEQDSDPVAAAADVGKQRAHQFDLQIIVDEEVRFEFQQADISRQLLCRTSGPGRPHTG